MKISKRLKKLNKFFEKYQPTIQTFGILLILATIFISIWQNYLTRNQVDFALEERLYQQNPKFEVSLKFHKSERLNDWLEINNKNYNHILQKINVNFLNKTDVQTFVVYNKILRLNKIKKIIIKETEGLFSDSGNSILHFKRQFSKSEVCTYPIIIDFNYIENDSPKEISILYAYKFQIYFVGKRRKIKTLGVQFIKKLNHEDNIKKILIKYNLNNSEPFNNSLYRNKLKLELIKKDSIFSPVYKFIQYNLITRREKIQFILKDSSYLNLYYDIPKFLSDSILRKKRDKELVSILYKNEDYNTDLIKKVIQINDSINMFSKMNYSVHLDSIKYTKYGVQLFEKYKREWEILNQELYDIALDNFKID
ncbi:hypothetical protein [Tenacibaculum halocynthiae]|uniref:hypothetical protein n=1 Tax=Tenacibaculum halocynthiae TaxID=1254437 RepID=UPI003D64F993